MGANSEIRDIEIINETCLTDGLITYSRKTTLTNELIFIDQSTGIGVKDLDGAFTTPDLTGFAICEAPASSVDAFTVELCDVNGAVTTSFTRRYVFDTPTSTPTTTDFDLDGLPYTVTGTVGKCTQASAPDYTALLTAIRDAVNNIDADTSDIILKLDDLITLATARNLLLADMKLALENLLPELQAINANTDQVESLITDTNTKLDAILAEKNITKIDIPWIEGCVNGVPSWYRQYENWDLEAGASLGEVTEYSADGITLTGTTMPVGFVASKCVAVSAVTDVECTSISDVNSVIDGQFTNVGGGNTLFFDWTENTDNGKDITVIFNPSLGLQFATFPAPSIGSASLSQIVTTTTGSEYKLSFLYTGTFNLRINNNGADTFLLPATNATTPTLYEYAFIADASTVTLDFTQSYFGSAYAISDVKLNEVTTTLIKATQVKLSCNDAQLFLDGFASIVNAVNAQQETVVTPQAYSIIATAGSPVTIPAGVKSFVVMNLGASRLGLTFNDVAITGGLVETLYAIEKKFTYSVGEDQDFFSNTAITITPSGLDEVRVRYIL